MKGLDRIASSAGRQCFACGLRTGSYRAFYLGQVYPGHKGLLSVDIGASAAVVPGRLSDEEINAERLSAVRPRGFAILRVIYQPGRCIAMVAAGCFNRYFSDYIYQKALYPASIPATKEEQAIAQAVTRQALYLAVQTARRNLPPARCVRRVPACCPGLTRILAGGGSRWMMLQLPGKASCFLLGCDLPPTGLTTIILDKNDLTSASRTGREAHEYPAGTGLRNRVRFKVWALSSIDVFCPHTARS